MSEAIAVVTFEQFCELKADSDRRLEFVGGRIYAMSGGSERHDLAAGLFYEAIAPGARKAGCRPFTANRLVRVAADVAYYPDVVVVCGPAAHRLYEENPTLVAEVLSPSTAETDRREKALAFTASPALSHYILIDPDRRRIEVAVPHPGGMTWQAYGPGDIVTMPYAKLEVDLFYDTLEESATTGPLKPH